MTKENNPIIRGTGILILIVFLTFVIFMVFYSGPIIATGISNAGYAPNSLPATIAGFANIFIPVIAIAAIGGIIYKVKEHYDESH